jgi:opacity protein-like surface antigen
MIFLITSARRAVHSVLAAAIILSPFMAAVAQPVDEDKYSLSLGLFVTDRNSDTQIDASGGSVGTVVDLEDDLGLDSSDSVFRVDGYIRFGEKHRFDFSVFDLSRTSSTMIQKDFEWNGTMFAIDTVVDSTFDLSIYKAAYTWAFLRRDSGYLGLTAGLYVADFGNTISAPNIGERETAEVTAPLPVFGLRGEYDFSERWSFRASGEFFVFEYEDFDGSLYDIYAGVDFQVMDHMAVGIGINSVKMDIGVTKPNASGNLDWQYDGGLIFLKFDF